METLGKRLQRLRESRGMTQDKLAHKAKVSVFNIRNWEQDHRTPGLAAVYHLARALRDLGQHEDALDLAEGVLDRYRILAGNDDAATLAATRLA